MDRRGADLILDTWSKLCADQLAWPLQWSCSERSRSSRPAAESMHFYKSPFTLIEIHLDKNGNGVGKLSLASKIRYNKQDGVLELEDYSAQPIRLQNVKVDTK